VRDSFSGRAAAARRECRSRRTRQDSNPLARRFRRNDGYASERHAPAAPAAWRAAGRPAYSRVQQQHSYLLAQPDAGQLNLIAEELLDYSRSERLTLFAYSPLLAAAYGHPDRSVPAAYQHAANHARLATLRDVAAEHGDTPNRSCSHGCCSASLRSSQSQVRAASPSSMRSWPRQNSSWTPQHSTGWIRQAVSLADPS
jgi:hypothetical protein